MRRLLFLIPIVLLSICCIFPAAALATHGNGSISGTVTDAETGNPVSLVDISIYNHRGQQITGTQSDYYGEFMFSYLEPGDYYLATGSYKSSYINVVYPDEACSGSYCSDTAIFFGEVVTVDSGAHVANINFQLKKGASVSVTLKDQSGSVILEPDLELFDAAGKSVGDMSIPYYGDKYYEPARGLPQGDYFLNVSSDKYKVADPKPYKCYEDGCNSIWRSGNKIKLSLTDSEDLALTVKLDAVVPSYVPGQIAGRVTDNKTGEGLANIEVSFYSRKNGYFSITTNSSGYYQSPALPPDAYEVEIYDSGYISQCYGENFCNVGGLVDVQESQTTENIDFALIVGGMISGHVRDGATGTPLSDVQIRIITADGYWVADAVTDGDGFYKTNSILEEGYYRVCAEELFSTAEYAAVCKESDKTLHDKYDSQNYLRTEESIFLSVGSTLENVNFNLQPGGSISGFVLDKNSLDPIEGVYVGVYDTIGNWLGYARSGSDGSYQTGANLVTGDYFIRTYPDDYVEYCGPELVPPCPYFDIPESSLVPVALGSVTTGLDIHLVHDAKIVGRILDGQSRKPIAGIRVHSKLGFRSTTDMQGRYLMKYFPAGNHLVRTVNNSGYFNAYLDGERCLQPDCAEQSGIEDRKVALNEAEIKKIGAVYLKKGPKIYLNFEVSEPSTMFVFPKNGNPYYLPFEFSGMTASMPALYPGEYILRTFSLHGDIDVYHDGSAVAGTNVSNVQPLVISSDTSDEQHDLHFSLQEGYRISGSVIDKRKDKQASYFSISIFDELGNWVGAGDLWNNLYMIYTGVPSGKYYIAIGRDSDVVTLHDGATARVRNNGFLSSLNVSEIDTKPLVVNEEDLSADILLSDVILSVGESKEDKGSTNIFKGAFNLVSLLLLMLAFVGRYFTACQSRKMLV